MSPRWDRVTGRAWLCVVALFAAGCHYDRSPVAITGSTTTSALGFPTRWFEFPIDGVQIFTSLSGTVTLTNSTNLFSEELFIIEFLPADACTQGALPDWAPNPQLSTSIVQLIVKAPTAGTFTVPIDFELPGGVPIDNCLALGINGGSVEAAHAVTGAANLSLTYAAPHQGAPSQTATWIGGEMCFGQDFGCQLATDDDSLTFASVTPITQTQRLVALYGDISDSTFDGGKPYGPPPAGAWTAFNDFFIYHGSECSRLPTEAGVGTQQIAGPGQFTGANIPADAVHLLSMPLSGNGIGVQTQQVFEAFPDTTIQQGDCFVTLWSLTGGGAFDNETQVFALLAPG